jgi:hypothetical protein
MEGVFVEEITGAGWIGVAAAAVGGVGVITGVWGEGEVAILLGVAAG